MSKSKLKIPVMAISIQEDSKQLNDFTSYNEKKFFEGVLYDFEELEKHTEVAHLILRVENQFIYPVYVKWYLVEISEQVIEGEEGYSFSLCLVGELEHGAFEVEYGFDVELSREIPKNIIIYKN